MGSNLLHARHWIGGEWIDASQISDSINLQAFDTEDEAVALANNSEYGLAASIWSTDVDRPRRVARNLNSGTVWINNWAIVYDETEERGYKQSGLGRLNGVSALDDFVEYRTIIQEIET